MNSYTHKWNYTYNYRNTQETSDESSKEPHQIHQTKLLSLNFKGYNAKSRNRLIALDEQEKDHGQPTGEGM